MIFSTKPDNSIKISRTNSTHPLASYSAHRFFLDDAEWPTVEHYYQAMKFEDTEIRQRIQGTPDAKECAAIAKKNKRNIRKDWENIKVTMMTRAVYTKCRNHMDVTNALLATGDEKLLETSQYDYFWGCGRDGRGKNQYGEVLMAVRQKLRDEKAPPSDS